MGGTFSRNVAADQSNKYTDEHTADDPEPRDEEAGIERQTDEVADDDAKQDADESSANTNYHTFDEELIFDDFLGSSHGFAYANFAVTFG